LLPLAAFHPAAAALAPRDLVGGWSGVATHAGTTSALGVTFAATDTGTVVGKISIAATHGYDFPLGTVTVIGDTALLGPVRFVVDASGQRMRGILPRAIVPVYEIPFELTRGAALEAPARPAPNVPAPAPVWTFDAGSPLWADVEFADGVVYAAGDDGVLHALD